MKRLDKGRRRLVVLTGALGMIAAVLSTSPLEAQSPPTCRGMTATIVGTPGNDRIIGTPRQDVIVALEGRDVIFGREGNDIICGGPGADSIKGGAGKDYIEGGGGNDRIVGGIGKDTIIGGPGKDRIFAGGGGDVLDGGKNSDLVDGQNGNDTCELDSTDRFTACEQGDVVGFVGFADGTYSLSPPSDFAVYQFGAGGGTLLQGQTQTPKVWVMHIAVVRNGGDTGTITVRGAGGELLAQVGSINASWFATIAVLSEEPPTDFVVETGGTVASFYIGYLSRDMIPTATPVGASGDRPAIIRIDPPTTAPIVFSWAIGPEATGDAVMLLYHADGTGSVGMFISPIEPDSPRSGSVQIDSTVVMVEVFVTGGWVFEFA